MFNPLTNSSTKYDKAHNTAQLPVMENTKKYIKIHTIQIWRVIHEIHMYYQQKTTYLQSQIKIG